MTLIASLAMLFVELVQGVQKAQGDAAKEEEALMAAEEKLSRIRAKLKFG